MALSGPTALDKIGESRVVTQIVSIDRYRCPQWLMDRDVIKVDEKMLLSLVASMRAYFYWSRSLTINHILNPYFVDSEKSPFEWINCVVWLLTRFIFREGDFF